MDTDSFVLTFDSPLENLIEFLKQNEDEFDFSELDNAHQLYNPTKKKVIGKTKLETSPVLVLDSFTALRSKSYSFSYNSIQKSKTKISIQKAKQKGIQNAPECEDYTRCSFMSETSSATNYSIRSNLHKLSVEKQNKLAMNPFDDKRVYFNPIHSLSWEKHTQKSDCPCRYCLKLIGLYYKELSTSETDGKPLRDEEIYYNIWTLKEKLNHQDLLNLISDRTHLL